MSRALEASSRSDILGRSGWPAGTRVAARHEPGYATMLRHAWHRGPASVDRVRLEAAARTGDLEAAICSLQLPVMGQAVRRASVTGGGAAFMAGVGLAADELEWLGVPAERAASGAQVALDLAAMNPRAVAWAESRAAELIDGPDELRAAILALVVDSAARGGSPLTLADQIHALVGLDGRRAEALRQFRTRVVDEARLEASRVEARVARYAEALRRDRAVTIARTETIKAVSEGQQAVWREAVHRGLMRPTAMGKRWLTTDDELLCPRCEPLADVVVGLDEPFPDAEGGPPLHPNCRCAIGLAERDGDQD